MNKNFMKKTIIISLMAIAIFSEAKAQYYLTIWRGDTRMGIIVGASHGFKPFDLSIPSGYNLDGEATTAFITPSIGLYSGREKEINRSTSFGFDGSIVYGKPITYATLKDAANNTYDYTFGLNCVTVKENVYFAFSTSRSLQVNVGAGIFEGFMFGGTATSESSSPMAPECTFGDSKGFGFSIGLTTAAGVTYYFSDSFFLKGSIDALIPLLSSGNMGMDDEWDFGYGSNPSLKATPTTGFCLGASVCIGFKW